jgi:hypothetical protein
MLLAFAMFTIGMLTGRFAKKGDERRQLASAPMASLCPASRSTADAGVGRSRIDRRRRTVGRDHRHRRADAARSI